MYLVSICVNDVVPLRGFVVNEELDGGHGLDLMMVMMMILVIMVWTSLSSESSFLLLGPGTEVTREGVAGSVKFEVGTQTLYHLTVELQVEREIYLKSRLADQPPCALSPSSP